MSAPETRESSARSLRVERLAMMIGFGLGSFAWNVSWPFLPLRVEAVTALSLGEVARLSGLLSGVAQLITAGLGPVWSTLGERYGYRLQIMRAHLGMGLSFALIGLARTPFELGGAAILLGMLGGNYPHYMALAASRSAAGEVGRVVGDMQAAGQIGGTIGPIVGGLVGASFGLTASFLVTATISIFAVTLVFRTIPADTPVAGAATRASGGLRNAFARPEQRWLMLILLVGDAGILGLRTLIPIVVAARIDDPAVVATTTGIITTLATAGTVVSAVVIGRVSRRIAPRTIMLGALPLAALCAALVPFAVDVWMLGAVWTLLGLLSGVTSPAIFAWLGRLSPSGGGYALLATTSMLAYAIGPAAMGQASIYGLDWPFRVATVMTLAGAALVVARNPRSADVS